MYAIHSHNIDLHMYMTFVDENDARRALLNRLYFLSPTLAKTISDVDMSAPRAGAGDKRFMVNDPVTHVQIWIQVL